MASALTFLIINPGSTSTKLEVYRNGAGICNQTVRHRADELARFPSVAAQRSWRRETVAAFLRNNGIAYDELEAVIGRGGLLRPVPGGVYAVCAAMAEELQTAAHGEHASNLGALLALDVAERAGCKAYVADPVVVDEMSDAARLTGVAGITRRSVFHALNQKAVARLAAAELGRTYGECRLIVAHLGGGISVGAHELGNVVDVNNALDGDGPFAVERAGTLPARSLADLCLSGKYTKTEIGHMLCGKGGLVSLWGSNDFTAFMAAVTAAEAKAVAIYNALVLNIAQEIARHGATLRGQVDGIVLTGGMARDDVFTTAITERTRYLGRVFVYPGEYEMDALAVRMRDVLEGREQVREYPCGR